MVAAASKFTLGDAESVSNAPIPLAKTIVVLKTELKEATLTKDHAEEDLNKELDRLKA